MIVAAGAGAYWQFGAGRAQAVDAQRKTVIVEFTDADIVTAKAPTAVDVQQEVIAEAAKDVENIDGGYKEKMRDFDNLPYAVYVVDAAGEQALRDSPLVESVSKNKLYRPQMDGVMSTLGGSPTTGFTAAGVPYNGAGTTIAVLDSGVDKHHPMLAGKVVSEACYGEAWSDAEWEVAPLCPAGATSSIDEDSALPCTVAECEHGTHVASIAAGSPQMVNDRAISGVASGANIVAMQIFSQITGGTAGTAFCDGELPCIVTTDAAYLAALDRVQTLSLENALTSPIVAINMSFGGGEYVSQAACDADMSPQATDVLHNLRLNHRIAPVAAAGNSFDPTTIVGPACSQSVVAVAATDKAGTAIAPYSNNNSLVDLLAPGGTASNGILAAMPGGDYGAMHGTSMAAPSMAGVFAALREKYPSATVSQLLELLQRTGVSVKDSRTTSGVTKKRPRVGAALAVNQAFLSAKISLSAKHTSYHATKISWKKVSGANQYKVYRSTHKTKSFKHIKTTTALSLTNTKLKTGTRYYYKVVPYWGDVSGLTSGTVSAKPSLAKAKITKAKTTRGQAKVSWKKVSGASGYKLYRAGSKNGKYKHVKTTKSRSYTNKGLASGKTYYYKVKAYRVVSKKQVSGTASNAYKVKTPRKASGVTKMSRSGICHAPGTRYYSQTKYYTAYSSLSKCLAAGGRKPLR